ncbi:hypothetical protein AQUCO_00400499v1, partial [Aquilegia coerulea]
SRKQPEEKESIEKQFEDSNEVVPEWKDQITIRSIVSSLLLSVVFTIIVMKLNLTTGIIPSLNVSAGLLGYFLLKSYTKILNKVGWLKQPFTRQENTVIQTCVVASSGIAFSGGFGSYLFGMSDKIAQESAEIINPANIKNPGIGWMIGFLFLVSFLGILAVVLIREALGWSCLCSFGWGIVQWLGGDGLTKIPIFGRRACDEFKFYFDGSAMYIGVGMICPYIINISMLLGAILSWIVMWPQINKQKGHWFPANLDSQNLHGLQGYKVFIAIAIILGDGLYNFVKIIYKTIDASIKESKSKNLPVVTQDGQEPLSYDDECRTVKFLTERIPSWIPILGYIIISIICITVVPMLFPPLKWYYVFGILLIAPILGFCNAYGCGLTDWSLASTYGKLAIFIVGACIHGYGGVLAGLAACGVMMNIVSTSSDLTQDFKTGYMTLASPKSMLASQLIGTAMGCVVSPSVFFFFLKANKDLGAPDSAYPAPYALVYRNMSILGSEGFSALPKYCLIFCCAFFAGAILVNIVRDLVGEKWYKFIPLPMAMAVPFYLGGYFSISMCIGSLILFLWRLTNRAQADTYASAIASGMICGDGIWTLPSALLSLFGVQAPFHINWFHR